MGSLTGIAVIAAVILWIYRVAAAPSNSRSDHQG